MIAVVHLVWGPLGPASLRNFLASYREHPAGADHELVMLFNGIDGDARDRLLAEIASVPHTLLELERPLQDIAAYGQAVERLDHERLCFLNSYSTIRAPNWLAYLDGALSEPGVGVVGATGSWASLHSAVLNGLLLPNAYRGAIPKRKVTRQELNGVELEIDRMRKAESSPLPAEAVNTKRTLRTSVLNTLRALRPMPAQLLRFAPFPAYHIRTNAFMARRELFAELPMKRVADKEDAYVFESGRAGMTNQVNMRGLRTLVVDRNGQSYDREHWHESNTLWQGRQEGLMVADNQTLTYANGGLERRRVLSGFAWASHADPR